MRTEYTIKILNDGTISTPGVSFGYGDCRLEILKENDPYLIIKKPGCNEWSGRGESSYFPVEYWLCRKRRLTKKKKRSFRIEVLFEIAPGRDYQQISAVLFSHLNQITLETEEEIIQQLKQNL